MIIWEDIENSINDCASICKKNNIIVFRIMESRDSFYADYYDNNLFKTPRITYLEAAQMAKEKYGEDTLKNRLEIAKDFFVEDYREQRFNRIIKLNNMDI